MAFKHIQVPAGGTKIAVNKDFSLSVPDQPIIPFIEGDGIGVDDLAEPGGTVGYEVLTRLGRRYHRVYKGG